MTDIAATPAVAAPEALQRYADALGLTTHDGGGAVPLLPTVLTWDPMLAVVQAVLAEADAPAGVVLTRHAAHLHRAVVPGEPLRVSARGGRRAGIPQGTLLEVHHDTAAEDGSPIAQQRTVLLLVGRGGTPEDRALVRESVRVTADADAEVTCRVALAADLPARYAEASGDRNPIHLDDEAARSAGLPGVVVHGMAVLAVVLDAAARAADVTGACTGVGAAFGRPALPGQDLDVAVWPDPTQPGRWGLRATGPSGPVLKRAWATFAG